MGDMGQHPTGNVSRRNLVPRAFFPGFGGGASHDQKCPAFQSLDSLMIGREVVISYHSVPHTNLNRHKFIVNIEVVIVINQGSPLNFMRRFIFSVITKNLKQIFSY